MKIQLFLCCFVLLRQKPPPLFPGFPSATQNNFNFKFFPATPQSIVAVV